MKGKNILIIGCSGHAKVIIDILEKQGGYNILGLIDKAPETVGKQIMGYSIIATDKDFNTLIKEKEIYGGIIAIGNNHIRKSIYTKIKETSPEFRFITAIHPSAQIGRDTEIGEGTVIMPGAIINPGAKIGIQCIINTNASIDHDCQIGNFCHIAPNSTIAGNVTIGNSSTIGLGTNIINNLTIGENTIIGAGSLVLENIPSFAIAYGLPAKVTRENNTI